MTTVQHTQNSNGILTITLNRPEKLNVLNETILNELGQLFCNAKTDPQVKGVLITGAGKAFCAGADINRLAEVNAQSGYEFAKHGQAIFRQLETLGKPSLAAINGYAFGGGCELAMAATIRIASDVAQFGQPEIKLGIIPGYGGTQRLSRLIGKGRALDLCLTGRFINAQMAYDWGLITEITTPEQLFSRSMELLLAIAMMPPRAVDSLIEVIDRGYTMSLDDALHLETIHFSSLCASFDKNEGVSAFLNKRKPEFIGA